MLYISAFFDLNVHQHPRYDERRTDRLTLLTIPWSICQDNFDYRRWIVGEFFPCFVEDRCPVLVHLAFGFHEPLQGDSRRFVGRQFGDTSLDNVDRFLLVCIVLLTDAEIG
jgi:hypothetical protein